MQTLENQLITLTRDFLAEMKSDRALFAVSLSSSLEKDLGVGSLEKAELFTRIEKQFSVQLTEKILSEAKTLNDLYLAMQKKNPNIHKTIGAFKPILSKSSVDPSKARTLIDLLSTYADTEHTRPHIYFQDETGNESIMTYEKLLTHAISLANGLQNAGLKPGDTVAIMLPTSFEFFYAFMGILLAGCIPVPIYPPFRPDQIEEYIKREAAILNNAEVRILITFQRAEMISKLLKTFIPSLKAVTTVNALSVSNDKTLPSLAIASHHPAMIQYTSGSTGDPKGVLLTHDNLLANIRAYGKRVQLSPLDVAISWLPLYHDMGLIGAWLGSFYHGIPLTLMSPLTFLTRPERWLWAIHYHHGTVTAAPNFAYELCLRKINDEAIEGLDLSSWRLAANGAEMVHPKTLERFYQRFRVYGLKPETLTPVYGLAESSVGLTVPHPGSHYKVDRISREAFEKQQRAIPSHSTDNRTTLSFACCGIPLDEHEIRIVNEHQKILEERCIGQLQFRGPSSMQGYYRNPNATKAVFHEGWWDTGDLAYLVNGELYITGRKKDVIIKAGRNLYPDVIEEAVAQIDGVREGCIAAFSAIDTEQGTEKLIVIAETKTQDSETQHLIRSKISSKIIETINMAPDEIILVTPKTIPKTSSGKLRRSQCKQAYLRGELAGSRTKAWQQLTKLFLTRCYKIFTKTISTVGQFFYAVYIALIVLMHFPIALGIVLFCSTHITQKMAHYLMRWIFACSGVRIKVFGKNNISNAPMVLVANHASYIDPLVLIAALPLNMTLVGKKEVFQTPFLRLFARKMGGIPVDRYDFQQSQSDANYLLQVLQNKQSLLLFPEGTFSYATGIRPFKAGAFKTAVDAGVPVCPIILSGTRRFLRANTWLPKWSQLTVIIEKPIYPREKTWSEVIRLNHAAREVIAKRSSEQLLDFLVASPIQRKE